MLFLRKIYPKFRQKCQKYFIFFNKCSALLTSVAELVNIFDKIPWFYQYIAKYSQYICNILTVIAVFYVITFILSNNVGVFAKFWRESKIVTNYTTLLLTLLYFLPLMTVHTASLTRQLSMLVDLIRYLTSELWTSITRLIRLWGNFNRCGCDQRKFHYKLDDFHPF